MNFLAHIYLSGENDLIKIGNFMADGIRGKQFEGYHPQIQKGILLHRAIDTYTDAHPIFRKSTHRLHANYHHYSGIIVDIFYDHFLAKNWSQYSEEPLEDYIDRFYESLLDHEELLSRNVKEFIPTMIEQNWLLNYQNADGIARTLTQMDRRMKNHSEMRYSINELLEFYDQFEQEFTLFFADIRQYVEIKCPQL